MKLGVAVRVALGVGVAVGVGERVSVAVEVGLLLKLGVGLKGTNAEEIARAAKADVFCFCTLPTIRTSMPWRRLREALPCASATATRN